MMNSLSIKNYKLFKSFSIENLPQILLLGGKNNCGKTSILEAVCLSLGFINPDLFIKILNWRLGGNISNVSDNMWFMSLYRNFGLDQTITLEYVYNLSKKKVEFRTEKELLVNLDDKDSYSKSFSSSEETIGINICYWPNEEKKPEKATLSIKNNRFLLEKRSENFQPQNESVFFISSTRPLTVEENAERYSQLALNNNAESILKALQILEPHLQSLNVFSLSGRSMIYGEVSNQKIPLSLMGQGIDRLVSILLAISKAKNGIVLVDELENGFHHSVLASVWEVITSHAQSNNTQIMVTTHSMELISGAIEGIPESLKNDFKYIRIDRKEDKFKVKNYNFESLSIALESELEVR